ncbi:hypothetical protein ACI65C_005776 [Semiaphis heraclei]
MGCCAAAAAPAATRPLQPSATRRLLPVTIHSPPSYRRQSQATANSCRRLSRNEFLFSPFLDSSTNYPTNNKLDKIEKNSIQISDSLAQRSAIGRQWSESRRWKEENRQHALKLFCLHIITIKI